LHTVPDCEIRGTDFPRRNIKLTARRWSELNAVNRETNRGIVPEINAARAEWTIGPHAGDCTDYAITKRHQLLMLGWPSRVLLLAEVALPSGEHHLILVVWTTQMDLVLDNLDSECSGSGNDLPASGANRNAAKPAHVDARTVNLQQQRQL
jgi:predicted transglutaminase-like cysteine proteinase